MASPVIELAEITSNPGSTGGVSTGPTGGGIMAPMRSAELFSDAFGRIDDIVPRVLKGLDAQALNWRPFGSGYSIAWLVWHLCRAQDEQLAAVAGAESVWKAGGYAARFGLALDPSDTGYGHNSEQVSAVHFDSTELLLEYHHGVLAQSLEYVRGLQDTDLDRIVDHHWDPVVTLGVRLVSILDDCVQHGGQAAYVKGLHVG
ncbi:mycothiol transferase [Arthrobacter sp. AQ5-05]|uniref:mycothiol transferase n=1 Tax=Arthrobacter sp. AQ5-05 TaxID=2184581 RepID=UPI002DDA18F6|nr:DinB family protein [Arthrobacter sp. AQ5-05]